MVTRTNNDSIRNNYSNIVNKDLAELKDKIPSNIADIKALSKAKADDLAKTNDSVAPDLSPNFAEVSSSFTPAPIYGDESTVRPKNLDGAMQGMAVIAASMASFYKVQGSAMGLLSKIQDSIFTTMDMLSGILRQLTDDMINAIDISDKKAQEAARTQARHSGFIGMVLAAVEFVVGFVIADAGIASGAFTGGVTAAIGFGIGALMMANAAAKFVASAVIAADPDKANTICASFMQSGLFGVFDLIEPGAAKTAETIFTLVTMVISLAEVFVSVVKLGLSAGRQILTSLAEEGIKKLTGLLTSAFAKTGVGLVCATIMLVNTALSIYGAIRSIIDQLGNDAHKLFKDIDKEKAVLIQNDQALAMGIFAWLLVKTVNDWTSITKDMQDSMGDVWASLIQNAVLMIVCGVSNYYMMEKALSVEVPDMEVFANKFFTAARGISVKLGMVNGVWQGSESIQQFFIALKEKTLSDSQAQITLLRSLNDIYKKNIEINQKTTYDLSTQIGDTNMSLAQSMESFTRSMNHAMDTIMTATTTA